MSGYKDLDKKRTTERRWRQRNRERCTYYGIKARCYNPKSTFYHLYGGRGIKMCDRWVLSIDSFLEDVGQRPSDRHSLDRIDNNGDYEPSNVRWALPKIQGNNKNSNRILVANGESHTLSEWADITSVNFKTIWTRLSKGWGIEEALGFKKHITNPRQRFDKPFKASCVNCGKEFTGVNRSRHCSAACRSNYHYHNVIKVRRTANA